MSEEDDKLRQIVQKKKQELEERKFASGKAGNRKSSGEEKEQSEDQMLRDAVKWKRRYRRPPGQQVAGVLSAYEKTLKVKEKKASPLVAAWKEVVPDGFKEYCKIQKVERGVMMVTVSDGAFLFQLQTMKKELIDEIQSRCKRVKLKDIKFVIGRLDS